MPERRAHRINPFEAKNGIFERAKEDEPKARKRSRSYAEHYWRWLTQAQPKSSFCSRKD